jgi:transcriptional regulator with XRE-family HTH domain
MTPFGVRLRELRAQRGVSQTQMAADLGLSAAYLSGLVRQICGYFGLIWDDADALAALAQRARPKVTIDTGGLSPRATELANLLADRIGHLSEAALDQLIEAVRDGDR